MPGQTVKQQRISHSYTRERRPVCLNPQTAFDLLVTKRGVCSVGHRLCVLCRVSVVGFRLVGHVVFVGYRAQQCDLNPHLLRVLEDGYVSKCCDAGCGDILRAFCLSY